MLKVYLVTDYVSIDGADWRAVGVCGYRATEKELSSQLILDDLTFDEAYEYLSRNYLTGIYTDQTLYKHTPLIRINYSDAWEPVVYRRFNNMSYKTEFEEWKNVSLDWIIKNLSADQCIQYLKDRGMAACPVLK